MRILHVISSPRGASSNSIKLGNAIVDRIREKDPAAYVYVKDLTKDSFPHLEENHLNAFFTPPEKHTDADKTAISHSNKAIQEIEDADMIVIGAPMYNFTISSTLKAWIDHIARAGLTFKYTDKGPVGMVTGKKVFIALATGGIYSTEQYRTADQLTPYLTQILAFLGMTDVSFIRGEGFAVGDPQAALDKAIDSIVI